MWTWHQPIRFEFPAAFVRDVLWPYLEIMRPVLVLNPHVQVYLSRRAANLFKSCQPSLCNSFSQSFFVNQRGTQFSPSGLSIYYSKM